MGLSNKYDTVLEKGLLLLHHKHQGYFISVLRNSSVQSSVIVVDVDVDVDDDVDVDVVENSCFQTKCSSTVWNSCLPPERYSSECLPYVSLMPMNNLIG